MFPDTITIYRHKIENGTDVYLKQVLNDFYAMRTKTLSGNQKGVESAKPTTIISSPQKAQSYGVEWDIKAKDRIVIGAGADITSFDDVDDAVIVQKIEINVIGSDVDNITIIGI